MTRSLGAPGLSALLLENFARIYDDVRCYTRVYNTAERNIADTGKSLTRVHEELFRLRRAISHLRKMKPLWFDENGGGVIDRKMPEINARAEAFSLSIVRPVSVFDDDWVMNMKEEANDLIGLIRRARRRVRKKTRMLIAQES